MTDLTDFLNVVASPRIGRGSALTIGREGSP